jgi:hypothetical protein
MLAQKSYNSVMDGNDTQKEVKQISSLDILRDFSKSKSQKIEESVGSARITLVLVLLAIIIPIAVIFALPGDNKIKEEESKLKDIIALNESRFQNPKSLDSDIKTAGAEFKVLSAKFTGTLMKAQNDTLIDCKAEKDKVFVEAAYTVTNISESELSLKSPVLLPTPTKVYPIFINDALCFSEQPADGVELFNNQFLKPGESKTILVHYMIPDTEKNLKMRVFDQKFDGIGDLKDYEYVDLKI